jgi:hypothetical protein
MESPGLNDLSAVPIRLHGKGDMQVPAGESVPEGIPLAVAVSRKYGYEVYILWTHTAFVHQRTACPEVPLPEFRAKRALRRFWSR